ncbi:MAG: SWIM zinc finger family protein [Desulfovibrio sp.]|nr:SWIM zinc finger family protein [Desulfovibrio sp.]
MSVEEKRIRAEKALKKLGKTRPDLKPVRIPGRALAETFWGKAWCGHMDRMADYGNRLPRGRSYVRNGTVCHLDIRPGEIEAWVSGTQMYTVGIRIKALEQKRRELIQAACRGKIGTLLDILRGKLSKDVMGVVCRSETGIFPEVSEISFTCSCPDQAIMCKHVAAALYGVGRRLDEEPELLFRLREADPAELFSLDAADLPDGETASLQGVDLGGLFGIDLTDAESATADVAGRVVPPQNSAPDGKKGGTRFDARLSGKTTTKDKARIEATPAAKTRATAKAGAKTTTKIEAEMTVKKATKTEAAAAKIEAKAGVRATAKDGASAAKKATKAEAKPEIKIRARAAVRDEAKVEAKDAVKAGASAAEIETKAGAKTTAKAGTKKKSDGRQSAETGARTLPVLDFDNLTGSAVASFREACGMSLYLFSSRLDVSEATILRWEKEPGTIRLHPASRKKFLALYKKMSRKS